MSRIHDYFLGGGNNMAADRECAERIREAVPGFAEFVLDNAVFRRTVVQHMLSRGITQFLDLGSGLGTVTAIHHLIPRQRRELSSGPHGESGADPVVVRMVAVDTDPVAVSHLQATSKAEHAEHLTVSCVDWRDTTEVCAAASNTLDLTRPVGILATAVLHWQRSTHSIADALSDYHRRLSPGSAMAITHLTTDHTPTKQTPAHQPPGGHNWLARGFDHCGVRATPRGHRAIRTLLGPWCLDDTGLVSPGLWRPDRASLRPTLTHLAYGLHATHQPDQGHPR